jgi:hypothetical protein
MIPLAAHMPAHVPANWPGWLVIIVIGLLLLAGFLKLLGGK